MIMNHFYYMRRLLMLLLVGLLATGSVVAAEESEPLSVLELRVYRAGSDEEWQQMREADPDASVPVDFFFTFYYIELADQPQVYCHQHVMSVMWQDAGQPYQQLDLGVEDGALMRLIRASEIPDAVTAPKATASSVVFDVKEPGLVCVRGMKEGTRVQAYAADGRAVATVIAAANGEATVNLKSQTRGMYIISVNQRETFKIMKP